MMYSAQTNVCDAHKGGEPYIASYLFHMYDKLELRLLYLYKEV